MWFLASLGAAPVIADAYDREELEAAMVRARPDAVVHQLTDLSTGDSTANARRRLHGTPNLVDAAHAAEVPRIVAQSVAWCYAPGDAPAREDVPLDVARTSRAEPALGVAALEHLAREVPGWVALRDGALYGPDTWFPADGARGEDARAGRLRVNGDVTSFRRPTRCAGLPARPTCATTSRRPLESGPRCSAPRPARRRSTCAWDASGGPAARTTTARSERRRVPAHPSWCGGFATGAARSAA